MAGGGDRELLADLNDLRGSSSSFNISGGLGVTKQGYKGSAMFGAFHSNKPTTIKNDNSSHSINQLNENLLKSEV